MQNFSKKAKEDFKLVRRAKTGDEKAYAELLERYRRSVYHLILKMIKNTDDSEDLTIEAFAKAFKNLHRFEPDYTFSTWLFRIATNNAIDFLRKKKLKTYSLNATIDHGDGESRIVPEIKGSSLTPQEEFIRAQKSELVHLFVDKLPPKYRQLVELRYFMELTYEEIAKEMQRPLGTIKAQLFRARELLYDMLKSKKESI